MIRTIRILGLLAAVGVVVAAVAGFCVLLEFSDM